MNLDVDRWRSFHDALYGHVDMPPVLQRLLRTATVRRLDLLRQLPDLSLSCPAATHTRLEHSMADNTTLTNRRFGHEGWVRSNYDYDRREVKPDDAPIPDPYHPSNLGHIIAFLTNLNGVPENAREILDVWIESVRRLKFSHG